MIDIETIIPEDLKRDRSQQIQSRMLWAKVLDHAYKEAIWMLTKDRWLKIKIWKRHIPSLSWFFRKDCGIGSLQWICDVLGLYEAEEVRKKVLGLTIEDAEKFKDIFELMGTK